MYKCKCTQIKSLLAVIALVLSSACAYTPLEAIKMASIESGIHNKIVVRRQRQFVIPKHSHIGLTMTPLNLKLSQNNAIEEGFISSSASSFEQTFAQVTLVNNSKLPRSSYDFLVTVSLLELELNKTEINAGETSELEKEGMVVISENELSSMNKLITYSDQARNAKVKLVLSDAKTHAILDVALIESRAGAIGNNSFADFMEQSLLAYNQAITTTMDSFTY
jgi:hypothetical protein